MHNANKSSIRLRGHRHLNLTYFVKSGGRRAAIWQKNLFFCGAGGPAGRHLAKKHVFLVREPKIPESTIICKKTRNSGSGTPWDPPGGGRDPPQGGSDPLRGGSDPLRGGSDPPLGGVGVSGGGGRPPPGCYAIVTKLHNAKKYEFKLGQSLKSGVRWTPGTPPEGGPGDRRTLILFIT